MKDAAYLDWSRKADPSVLGRGIYRQRLKRLMDLVLAVALLPMVAPLVAILWLMVRLDGGPGFYWQERVGRDGRRFRFWKLRSMVTDADAALRRACEADPRVAAEWHEMQKLRHDPRVTRLGAVLRKTSLDELPQLWNVLRGDMSLIGPRPFTVEQEKLYVEAGGTAYFRLRPGVTGLWQVEGRSATSFLERIRFDNAYYANLSLPLDLRILWRTCAVVLRGTGC
ncbi:sugar transferase [Halovulum dunhuangense]|uniref:Sugar transferase n=2 Tax=Halovulum dunhuangense TaxID=1505036 RepID=A0A849L205_9RHOB|nr:sugar transferase [Halovulum dunhuangense]